MNADIRTLRGREIFDSRGRPTVEVDVELSDGSIGRAAVPSGASTGAAEAFELRDRDPRLYGGLGVRSAVAYVNGEIGRALIGRDALQQQAIDSLMVELDGSEGLSRLGANAVLGVSLAVCRAGAIATRQPLYARIAELSGTSQISLPVPMVNILSGGLHAGRGMDVQDFLAIPMRARSIDEALELMARVRNAAADVLADRGLPTLLADEGGLSPGFSSSDAALQAMVEAIERAGLRPGVDVSIAIDVAASSLRSEGGAYSLAREGREASGAQMIDMVTSWVDRYPVVSIEDALGEEDWDNWEVLSRRLGSRVQLVGDDLFTTNAARVHRGVARSIANGVLIKVNQNGTLSGTLGVIGLALGSGYASIISARSGETEDSFIADLAVGTGAGQIKIGSLRCSDRLSKYNQLIRIAEYSGAPLASIESVLGRSGAQAL